MVKGRSFADSLLVRGGRRRPLPGALWPNMTLAYITRTYRAEIRLSPGSTRRAASVGLGGAGTAGFLGRTGIGGLAGISRRAGVARADRLFHCCRAGAARILGCAGAAGVVIGRASCRGRVCKFVEISVVSVFYKQTKHLIN